MKPNGFRMLINTAIKTISKKVKYLNVMTCSILTSMHSIYSYLDVVLSRQKFLQGRKVKDIPQHVCIGFH